MWVIERLAGCLRLDRRYLRMIGEPPNRLLDREAGSQEALQGAQHVELYRVGAVVPPIRPSRVVKMRYQAVRAPLTTSAGGAQSLQLAKHNRFELSPRLYIQTERNHATLQQLRFVEPGAREKI